MEITKIGGELTIAQAAVVEEQRTPTRFTSAQIRGGIKKAIKGMVVPKGEGAVTATPAKKPKPKTKPAVFLPATKFNGKLFSADIIAKREKDNLTQRAAAKAMKMSPSGIFGMEANHSCNVSMLHTVCNWLDYPVTRYFTDQKKK